MYFKKIKLLITIITLINSYSFCQQKPDFVLDPTIKSLLLPGWGQNSLNYKKRAKIFYYTEASILLFIVGTMTYSNILERNYIAFASAHASLTPFGKNHDYWVDIGNFKSINDFNDEYLRNRRIDELYPEGENWHWKWDSIDNQKFFERKRIKSDQYQLISTFGLGFLALNHAISMIDAIYLKKLKMNDKVSIRFNNSYQNNIFNYQISINF